MRYYGSNSPCLQRQGQERQEWDLTLHKSTITPCFNLLAPYPRNGVCGHCWGKCRVQEAFEPLPRGHACVYLTFTISWNDGCVALECNLLLKNSYPLALHISLLFFTFLHIEQWHSGEDVREITTGTPLPSLPLATDVSKEEGWTISWEPRPGRPSRSKNPIMLSPL